MLSIYQKERDKNADNCFERCVRSAKCCGNRADCKEVEKLSVGENIRRIREEKGIPQSKLAEKCGVSQSMICQIERGTKVPTLPLSVDIAKVLHCKLENLTV